MNCDAVVGFALGIFEDSWDLGLRSLLSYNKVGRVWTSVSVPGAHCRYCRVFIMDAIVRVLEGLFP